MDDETNNPGGALLSPEGVIMFFIAGLFDVAGWLCAILVWAFGIGALLGRIVSVGGFIVIGGWQFFRSGTLPSKKGGPEKGEGIAGGLLKKFLKKHWKKIVVEAIPVLGDIYPGFTMMVYSELKSS